MYKEVMSKKTIKREDIENLPKEALIEMIVSLSESVNELSKNIEILTDTIRMMNQRRFGIKSEINKSETIQQLALDLVFNEAEELFDDGIEEPKLREAAPRKSKVKGKKLSDLSKITNRREETVEIRKEELDRTFGENNWKLVTYEKVNKLEHHPASFEAVTYNIAVYSVKDEKKNLSEVSMIRAERPFTEVIPGSIVTPSLLASILHGKYVNAHVHLSVAYLFMANESEFVRIKEDENNGVEWLPLEKIDVFVNEKQMKPVYKKILNRIKNKQF